MAYKSVNPYNSETYASYDTISDSELESILENSYNAFLEWRTTSFSHRAMLLNRLAELLERDCGQHGRVITREMGKPLSQSIAEVRKSALACRYYASSAEKALAPVVIKGDNTLTDVRFDPQGTVFAIMPWNFPYWQLFRCLAPALMAGNSLLLKHASNVPESARMIAGAVLEAGFPGGLFHNLFVSHEQVARVIASRYVTNISLTGSNLAGERIASLAGKHIKRCVLELGGSDPFIVFPDADLDAAAEAAITGRFQNSGQSCIAAKRLFLHDDIYDSFMAIFRPKVEALVCGNPMEEGTDIGPLVNREAVDTLIEQLNRSLELGDVITNGLLPVTKDCLFTPIITENVPDDSPVAVEETFGPVLPVFRFNEYGNLIERVNSSVFGLGSSVWTSGSELAQRIAADIDAGTVSINGFTRSDPAIPFGGVKESGYGRELSEWGLKEFVNIKSVTRYS